MVLDEEEEQTAKEVVVTFANPIDPTTFDADDVVLMNENMQKSVIVTSVDANSAVIDLSKSNLNRFCTLTVFTSGVKNPEGIAGTTSKSIEWKNNSSLLGDANGDGQVSVTDVTLVVNVILGNKPEVFFRKNADVDGNGEISVTDVTGITRIVLDGQ